MSLRALIVDNGSRSTGLIGQLAREAGWQTATVSAAGLGSAGPADHSDAVILTGTDLPAFTPGYEAEIRLIRSAAVPILGICGGMHLVGRAFGVGLDKGPPVIGRTVVQLASGVELFEEMPAEVSLFQRHIYRLTAAPPGFAATASSLGCPIEGIGHPGRAIYGMQAHVEFRAEGRCILRRFLCLAERRLAERRLAEGRMVS
jgi:GMP synthase-like glutamine amidotransferase